MSCTLALSDGTDVITLPSPVSPLDRTREKVGSEGVTLGGFGFENLVRVRRVWSPSWPHLSETLTAALEARFDGADGAGPFKWTTSKDGTVTVLFRDLAAAQVADDWFEVTATFAEV